MAFPVLARRIISIEQIHDDRYHCSSIGDPDIDGALVRIGAAHRFDAHPVDVVTVAVHRIVCINGVDIEYPAVGRGRNNFV